MDTRILEYGSLKYAIEKDISLPDADKVTVVFFDDNLTCIERVSLKVIKAVEIYEKIKDKQPIELNGVYLKDFSLSEYRTKYGLQNFEEIEIFEFKANDVFFDCEQIIDFSGASFRGKQVDFSHSVFGNGKVDFSIVKFNDAHVNFKHSRFGNGLKNFQSVSFGKGDVSFRGANFGNGDVVFSDTFFGYGVVEFRNTVFGKGNVDFKFVKFRNTAIVFERAEFNEGRKDFKNTEFGEGKADFRRVNFGVGDVLFEGVEFGGEKLIFRGSVFGKGHVVFDDAAFSTETVSFDKVEFGEGTLSFCRAKARNVSFAACSFDCFVDFKFASCDTLNLSGAVIRDIIDVVPDEATVSLKQLVLINTRILGRLFINWRENKVYDIIVNQNNSDNYQKAEQFRILKENFRVNGQYEDEDLAYISFKRFEAKTVLQKELNSEWYLTLMAYPKFYFQQYIFDYVGRYATSPARVIMNGIFTIFIFGLLYYFINVFFPSYGSIESTLPSSLNHFQEFWNSIYYSAITFFTIGYGDYFPHGILKLVAAFEGFSGVFLMSYFTVAFVRKILR